MKQIVFLIGTFVVLLQLHSTTATVDSQSEWETTQSTILDNTEKMKDWVNELKETGKTAWKNANFDVPEEWEKGAITLIEILDIAELIFIEVTDEGSKASSILWAKIAPGINDVVTRISLAFEKSREKVKDTASVTQKKIDEIAVAILERLAFIIKSETLKTVNIVRQAEQEVSNVEKSTSDSQKEWDRIKAKIEANIVALKKLVKAINEAIDREWEKHGVEAPANWDELEKMLLAQLDQALIELSELIEKLSKTSSLRGEAVQERMDERVTGLFFEFYEIGKKIKDTVLGTKQEIQASVDEGAEQAMNLIKIETVNTKNILIEAAQKNSNGEQAEASSGSA